MSSASRRETIQTATASGTWSAIPSQSTGLASRNGTWPVWTSRSRCSWVDERDDRERRERHRRLAARAGVGGEAEQRERGEDQDDLRRVREVAVHVVRAASR